MSPIKGTRKVLVDKVSVFFQVYTFNSNPGCRLRGSFVTPPDSRPSTRFITDIAAIVQLAIMLGMFIIRAWGGRGRHQGIGLSIRVNLCLCDLFLGSRTLLQGQRHPTVSHVADVVFLNFCMRVSARMRLSLGAWQGLPVHDLALQHFRYN